jgi:hypothetical protein
VVGVGSGIDVAEWDGVAEGVGGGVAVGVGVAEGVGSGVAVGVGVAEGVGIGGAVGVRVAEGVGIGVSVGVGVTEGVGLGVAEGVGVAGLQAKSNAPMENKSRPNSSLFISLRKLALSPSSSRRSRSGPTSKWMIRSAFIFSRD